MKKILTEERLAYYADTRAPLGYTGTDIAAMAQELQQARRLLAATPQPVAVPDDVTPSLNAMMQALEAVSTLLSILDRHSVELGFGAKPVALSELVVARDGADELNACRAIAASNCR